MRCKAIRALKLILSGTAAFQLWHDSHFSGFKLNHQIVALMQIHPRRQYQRVKPQKLCLVGTVFTSLASS